MDRITRRRRKKLGFDSLQLVEDPAGLCGAAQQGPGLALGFMAFIMDPIQGEGGTGSGHR